MVSDVIVIHECCGWGEIMNRLKLSLLVPFYLRFGALSLFVCLFVCFFEGKSVPEEHRIQTKLQG